MFCSRCGSNNADGQKFCSNCGNPLPAQVNQPQVQYQAQVYNPNQNGTVKRKKFPAWGVVAIIAAILVVIVALAALIMGLSKSNDDNNPVNAGQTVTDDGAQKVADALVQAILTKDISKIEEYIAFSDKFYAALDETDTPRSEFESHFGSEDWAGRYNTLTFEFDPDNPYIVTYDNFVLCMVYASLYADLGENVNGKVIKFSDIANGSYNEKISNARKNSTDEFVLGALEWYDEGIEASKNGDYDGLLEKYGSFEKYCAEFYVEEMNAQLSEAGINSTATDMAIVPISIKMDDEYYFVDEAWLAKIDGEWLIIRLDF
ncbi:MAG: zinc-ribbon domain-containing protein [Candidatus Fimenecus sp.]